MSTTVAAEVEWALGALVKRAGVMSDDLPPVAAKKVLAVLKRDRVVGERSNPDGCVLRNWLVAALEIEFASIDQVASNLPRLLVTPDRVMVSEVRVPPAKARRTPVMLPRSVADAVAMADARATLGGM